jgi:hypothetical protein
VGGRGGALRRGKDECMDGWIDRWMDGAAGEVEGGGVMIRDKRNVAEISERERERGLLLSYYLGTGTTFTITT